MSISCNAATWGVVLGVVTMLSSPLTAQIDLPSSHAHPPATQSEAGGLDFQSAESMSRSERITLTLHEVTLKAALREIARRGRIPVLYNDAEVPGERLVSISVNDTGVVDAIRLLLRDTGLVARSSDGGIVIERARPGDAPAERADSTGAISGRVIDASTGAAVTGARVVIADTNLAAISGDDGRFRIGGIGPGMRALAARRLGYLPATIQVVVDAGSETVTEIRMTPSPQTLDQVVTTGTVVPTEVKALPNPISIITDERIASQPRQTLASIVRQAVPTAVAFDAPNIPANTTISVRGTTSMNGTGEMKIFVDGVEASSFSLSPVDPVSISRIEVIRGPQAATIYGADAASGVIQIFTKRGDPAQSRPRFDGRASLGVSQTPYDGFKAVTNQKYSTSVSGGDEGTSYRFGASYTHLADYAPENGHNRQSTAGANGAMRFERGMVSADLSARYYRNDIPLSLNPLGVTTGYAGASRPWFTDSYITNETYGVRILVTPAAWLRSQLTLGVDRSTLQYRQRKPRFTTPADSLLLLNDFDDRKLSVGYNASATWSPTSTLSGSITVGIDHYTKAASTITAASALNVEGDIATDPPGALNVTLDDITNTGLFAQTQIDAAETFFLTAGVRMEDNSTFGTDYGRATLPRVGLSIVRPIGTATAKLRASFGKALRTPGIGQASRSVNPGSIQLANPNLAPERQEGWDGGVDLSFGRQASLSITLFDQTARDLIAFLQLGADPVPTYQNQNIGRVSNRGVEVVGTLDPATWLRLTAQYGYTHSRVEAVDTAATQGMLEVGDQPTGFPVQSAGAEAIVTPRGGTTMSLGLTFVGGYRQIDALGMYRCLATFSAGDCPESFLSNFSFRGFIADYPGFAKINATVKQQLSSHLEAFFSVDNLLNNEQYEGMNTTPVIGRTTAVGIHFTF